MNKSLKKTIEAATTFYALIIWEKEKHMIKSLGQSKKAFIREMKKRMLAMDWSNEAIQRDLRAYRD